MPGHKGCAYMQPHILNEDTHGPHKLFFKINRINIFINADIVPTNPAHAPLTSITSMCQESVLAVQYGWNIALILLGAILQPPVADADLNGGSTRPEQRRG